MRESKNTRSKAHLSPRIASAHGDDCSNTGNATGEAVASGDTVPTGREEAASALVLWTCCAHMAPSNDVYPDQGTMSKETVSRVLGLRIFVITHTQLHRGTSLGTRGDVGGSWGMWGDACDVCDHRNETSVTCRLHALIPENVCLLRNV